MKKYFFYFLTLLILASQINSQNIPEGYKKVKELGGIEEYLLESNGLNVLLLEEHSAPVLTFMVTYRVGSRNEVTGTTGATHILEHLMFKGTPTFNKAKGTQISATLQNIGALINATTWLDRTNYYENIPSDQLELAVHIESDRMRNSLLKAEDRDAEMTVVRNEFEQGENNPVGVLDKELWANAYLAHPYHHSTIGWRSDIENVPIEKLKEFYDTFYWPNNATVTIIGDFEKNNALGLIKKYFGAISSSPHEIPKVYTEEPEQLGPRRVIVKKAGQLGVIGIGFKSPPGLHEDTYSMLVLNSILTNGKTSRLYKKLIDTNKAVSVFTWYTPFKDAGLFPIYSRLSEGTTYEEVEKIILDEIENIKLNGVTKEEVNRAISKIVAQTTFGRDGSFSIASQINEAIAKGDWTYYVNYLDNINKVTPASVKKVVENYFVENKSVTGYFIPQKSGSDESSKSTSMLQGSHDKLFYRGERENADLASTRVKTPEVSSSVNKSTEITRKSINGIDVVSVKTGVKDVVTFTGSLVAGDYYSPKSNSAIADLTARMLDKGTTKNDKFALAEKLENIGATLSFGTGKHTISFNGKCLKKDIETVIDLLAEQLKYPAFDESEFTKLKNRISNSFKQSLENTNTRADVEMDRQIFPKGHPNYVTSIQQLIDDIEKATLQEVKDFYKKYYGPKSMIFVAVGDLTEGVLNSSIKKSFNGWTGGVDSKIFDVAEPQTKGSKHIITIPDKASATLLVGQASTLKKSDPEYLPLHIGLNILGGNFSARLMSIIRDDEGLTYGIYSWHADDIYSDGRWQVQGAFNPALLNKGYESTMRELKRWIKEGVTEQELKNKKSTLIGSFKVQLATTNGIAGQILSFVQRGFDPEYIYEYPQKIEKVTLDQVNESIKKYVKYNELVTVIAGSVDENGNPLN